jgi:hypothetical protein
MIKLLILGLIFIKDVNPILLKSLNQSEEIDHVHELRIIDEKSSFVADYFRIYFRVEFHTFNHSYSINFTRSVMFDSNLTSDVLLDRFSFKTYKRLNLRSRLASVEYFDLEAECAICRISS